MRRSQLIAKFYGTDKKLPIRNRQEMDEILKSLEDCKYEITEVKKGERIKNAPLPFTTSTLQQEAAKTLNFSTQKTMRLAQQLYEGVDVKGSGTVGLISYLRTDSTRISEEADAAARTYISEQYGLDYVSQTEKAIKNGQKIQDAHEAIRPTDIARTPVLVKESLTRDQFRLYQLIGDVLRQAEWHRHVMRPRLSRSEQVSMCLRLRHPRLPLMVLCLCTQKRAMTKGQCFKSKSGEGYGAEAERAEAGAAFTQPPAHYTEASLVKTMEELGIGRPSNVCADHHKRSSADAMYPRNRKIFTSQSLERLLINIMKQAFPSIVDVNFTANYGGAFGLRGSWYCTVENGCT